MNKKFILPLIVSASAAMFAAGCGTKTVVVQSAPDAKVYSSAQELAGVVKGNMNAVNYFTIEENFRIDAKISAYGQSSDMKMEGKGSGEMQLQPEYGHFNLDMSQRSSAGNVSSKSESYISGTGANAKGYIRTNGGEWSKDTSVTGIEFDALMEQFAGKSLIESVSNGETIADIDNNGGQVNGKDTYKISARVNGDIAGASFSDSLSSLNAVTGDWSNLYADMDLYIYKDSALPAKITVDGAELLKGIMEGMGIDCQIREYTGEFTINDYNNESATVLTIPDNVILEAGDSQISVTTSAATGNLSKKDSDNAPTTSTVEATVSSSETYVIMGVNETNEIVSGSSAYGNDTKKVEENSEKKSINLKETVRDLFNMNYDTFKNQYGDLGYYHLHGSYFVSDKNVPGTNYNVTFHGYFDGSQELPDSDAYVLYVTAPMSDIFESIENVATVDEFADVLSPTGGAKADIGFDIYGQWMHRPNIKVDTNGDGKFDLSVSFNDFVGMETIPYIAPDLVAEITVL